LSQQQPGDARDDEFVFVVYVSTGDASTPKQTRLLEVVRNHRTKSLSLCLPEENEIVSLGWVPEIVYATKDTDYELSVTLRPDLRPFLDAAPRALHARAADSAGTNGRATGHADLARRDHGRALPAPVPDGSSPPPNKTVVTGVSTPAASPTRSRDDHAAYAVTFANREIRVNGFRLSRPNFNSENELAFDYVFANPNRTIELAEIEGAIGKPLTKRLREVVRDLGFKNELKEMFFPGISKTSIKFINPITRADFESRDLRPPRAETMRREKE
jgi:hypothetical protein